MNNAVCSVFYITARPLATRKKKCEAPRALRFPRRRPPRLLHRRPPFSPSPLPPRYPTPSLGNTAAPSSYCRRPGWGDHIGSGGADMSGGPHMARARRCRSTSGSHDLKLKDDDCRCGNRLKGRRRCGSG